MRFLPTIPTDESWWIALVTFERGADVLDVVPPECEGAVGWQACIASGEGAAEATIRKSMSEVGLIVLEVGDLEVVSTIDEVEEIDQHLAQNVINLEPGKRTVWGEIHLYYAAAEA